MYYEKLSNKKKQEYRWNRWMLPEHAIVGTGNIILDKERYTVYTHCTSKWPTVTLTLSPGPWMSNML